MKLLPIAYLQDPNTNTFVAFKKVNNIDKAIAEFPCEEKLTTWIDDNFVAVKQTSDYTLCKPTRYLNIAD